MNNTLLHTTGPNLDMSTIGRRLARKTEQTAVREAANQQQRIARIEDGHRQVIRQHVSRIFNGLPPEALSQVERAAEMEVGQMAATRTSRFDARMQVGHIDSAGLQKGDQILVAPEHALAAADGAVAREINDHEVQHLDKQAREISDVLIRTGDPEADRLLSIPPVAFFEADAMLAAGFENTSWQYVTDYLWPVQDIADYVNGASYQGGIVNGPALMRHAAETGDIATVRRVILATWRQKQPMPARIADEAAQESVPALAA